MDLLVTVSLTTFRDVSGSGLLPPPAPLVVGWAKYVPQNVPPHAWTTSYHNTGLRVLPAPPPYYAPSYPQPIVPVTQPVYPVAPVAPLTPIAPVLPPPSFNANPAFIPTTPAFNNVPVFGGPALAPPFLRTPAAFPVPLPRPEGTPSFPANGGDGSPQSPGDNGGGGFSLSPQPANLVVGPQSGYPNNFFSPIVSSGYPSKFVSPHPHSNEPLRINRPQPSYRVTENLEPEPVYGPPPAPFSTGKYRSTPSETYGPPPTSLYHGKSESIIREYPSHPQSHIVRVVRPYSKYRESEYFK